MEQAPLRESDFVPEGEKGKYGVVKPMTSNRVTEITKTRHSNTLYAKLQLHEQCFENTVIS